jgi:hypothetical protein
MAGMIRGCCRQQFPILETRFPENRRHTFLIVMNDMLNKIEETGKRQVSLCLPIRFPLIGGVLW